MNVSRILIPAHQGKNGKDPLLNSISLPVPILCVIDVHKDAIQKKGNTVKDIRADKNIKRFYTFAYSTNRSRNTKVEVTS